MQTTRGPTGPASSTPQKGGKPGGATSSLTRLYTLAFVTIGPLYLLWRATVVGVGWQLALSIPFLSIEIWAWLQIVCLRHQVIPPRSTSADDQTNAPGDDTALDDTALDDTVEFDVVITTGPKTTVADIEQTLLGLTDDDHNRLITVLSAEPDIQSRLSSALSGQLHNLRFVHIGDGTPHSPLALAIQNSMHPWVLWLEAGQVAMPELTTVVGDKLRDPQTAVCQIATGLLSPGSLAQIARDGDEEALEHELIGQAMAQRGLAPWHGPGSLIRSTALPQVDAMDDPSAFNVSWCAIELQRNGWSITYERSPLIRVPAADSLRPYLTRRRDRSLAVLEQLGYAFSLPDVPWAVRVAALSRAVSVTHGLRQLAMVLVLVGSLLSGMLPVAGATGTTMALIAGYTGAALLARRSLSGRAMALGDWVRHGWRTLGADSAALVPRLARPVAVLRSRTADTAEAQNHGLSGRLQLPMLAFGLLQVALVARAVNVIRPTLLPSMSGWASVVVILTSTVITIQLIDVLGGLTRPGGRRESVRVPLKSDISIGELWGQTLDVTPFGVGAIMEAAPPTGATVPLTFAINDINQTEHVITAEGEVRSATTHRSGLVRVGLKFAALDDAHRLALTRYCALGIAQPKRSAAAAAENPGRLPTERTAGDLILVRVLAVISIISAIGTLFIGPAADPVVADDNGVTTIPDSFAIAAPTNSGDGLEVRLHTDDWSEPLTLGTDGTFSRPAGPGSWPGAVHLDIRVGPDRFVIPVDQAVNGVQLAALSLGDGIDQAELVGPGGVRYLGTDGQALVPGHYTVTVNHSGSGPSSADAVNSVPTDEVSVSKLIVNQGEIVTVDLSGVSVGADRTEPNETEPNETEPGGAGANGTGAEDS